MEDKIRELVKKPIQNMGYQLVNVRIGSEPDYNGGKALTITINKEGGITLNDCANVSRALSPLLDEKDIIPDSYILEVSSPGVSD